MELINAITLALYTKEDYPTDWNHVLEKEWALVVSSMHEASGYGFYHTTHQFSRDVIDSPRIQQLITSRLETLNYEVENDWFDFREPEEKVPGILETRQGIRISWERFSLEHWEE